jgi:uncharacterized protein YggE
MSRKLITLLGAFVLVALFTTQAFAKEITVQGRLQRTVEPGGWLITASNQKYLILNAQRFEGDTWFAVGNEVEAVGETRTDVVTTQMEGTPFEARTMRPLAAESQSDVKGLTKVMVTGDSIVSAQPDTAILTIAVVTQGRTAVEAQQANANQSDAVVRSLKAAAGASAEVKTSGYSLQPMRVYKEGQPPTITGYEARNSVTVVTSDLAKVGAIIDATAQAGANEFAGLSFTLRKDRPARDQALAESTREALNKARVIATALGGRVVRIIEVQEEGTATPRPIYQGQMQLMRSNAAPTPIEVGTMDITSRVQLVAEIEVGTR